MEAPPACSCAFGLVDLAQHGFFQSITPADDLQPRASLPEPFRLQTQESAQQPEDALYLRGRPAPIVGGKGVDREATDAYVRRAFNNAPQRDHSGTMTGDAGQS